MANLEIRNFAKICFILILFCNYVFTQENVDKKCSFEGDEEQLNYFDETNLRSSKVENEYIVAFKKYMPHGEHRLLLSKLIGTTGWEILQRNNLAWNFPSDFSLIKIINTNVESITSILNTLRKSEDVKYVTPQRRFVGGLKSIEEVNSIFKNSTGRMLTRFSMEEDENHQSRKLQSPIQVTELFNSHFLWEKGYTGTGIRVAVFDTGLRQFHPHFKNVVEITNWTDENTKEDGLGHGTFVAGVIASQSTECLGFAPDSDVFVFRVFTNNRVSFTSWFLDAFNYAIHSKINVLNLSIGGPDFMDRPFVEKVWELSANNVIVVSAIGNDGPLYGTLNNPADQLDVIGVGGVDFAEKLAGFSSRGMTTWELPLGYGRVKPDLVAYGQSVQGSRIYGGCRSLSGTSVASPVVAGAVTLLCSTLPENKRWDIINPASMKQVLISSAERLPENNMFEQGAGKLNILGAYELLNSYVPKATTFPANLDLTKCPYMWPYCSQPIFYGGSPVIVNVTILNGMGVSGEIIEGPIWKPGRYGDFVEISFDYPETLWPWTGYLALHIRVHQEAINFKGNAEGVVLFKVQSAPGIGETEFRNSIVEIPIKVSIVPTPHRSKRILWDQFHNLRYPSGYFPRDSLDVKDEPFDWNADHPHTNFKTMFEFLREKGYFIDILGSPFTCVDASQYGTLMIVDSEDEFFPSELKKLKKDVEEGLSIIVMSDWYNIDVMKKINFYDENTQQWWTPATGGSNLPAVNDLLEEFGIAMGDIVFNGDWSISKDKLASFSSGNSIAKFPKDGSLMFRELSDQTKEILGQTSTKHTVPILGLYPTANINETTSGRIAVYGDSNCLDDSQLKNQCFWFLEKLLFFTMETKIDNELPLKQLDENYVSTDVSLPRRLEGTDLPKFSKVVDSSVSCVKMNFQRQNKTEGETLEIVWEEPNMLVKQPPSSGVFSEAILRKQKQSAQENVSDLFLPYLIGCVVVVFVVAIALKTRKDRLASKRLVV